MTGAIVLSAASLTAWIVWFYVAPNMALHWPHPGQSTVYFSWRHRPEVVRRGLVKEVVLQPSQVYVFSVDTLRSGARAQITIRSQEKATSLLVNDRPMSLLDAAGQGSQFQTVLNWSHERHHILTLKSMSDQPITIRDISLLIGP